MARDSKGRFVVGDPESARVGGYALQDRLREAARRADTLEAALRTVQNMTGDSQMTVMQIGAFVQKVLTAAERP